MKFLCVVLLALIGISASLAQPHRHDCYTDAECGEFCFCLQGEYEPIGQCIGNCSTRLS